MNRKDKILLTGATGFIGSHVLEGLNAAGYRVTALIRERSQNIGPLDRASQIRFGNILDVPSICEAARGCRQVVHVAGLAKDWGSYEEFDRTNVTGTLNVLEACRVRGISQIVLTGSISSYGEENCLQPKDETFPYRSHYPYFLDGIFPSAMNFYRDSKARATQEAVAFARQHGLNVTIIEPAWVYGEREFGTGFHSYVQSVQHGCRFMPGTTRNLFHAVYARDLAKAYMLACRRKLPGVERIIVGNSRAEPMHNIFGLFCDEAGVSRPKLVPKWSAYPIALGLELSCRLLRLSRPPLLTRGRVNMFYDSIHYSTEKARRLLGFECDYSLEHGVRKTVAWYKENHYL